MRLVSDLNDDVLLGIAAVQFRRRDRNDLFHRQNGFAARGGNDNHNGDGCSDTTKTDSFILTVEPIVPEVVSIAILHEDGTSFSRNFYTVNLSEGTFGVMVDVQVRDDMTKAYTLVSADTDVATVADDVVTLVKTGTTQLIAAAEGNEEITATLDLIIYDDLPHNISVTGGVAKNAEGLTVTSAVNGETITLVPDEPEAGMEFVTWNISGASVTVGADNTFTFPGTDISVEAVYGYIPDTFTLNFPK